MTRSTTLILGGGWGGLTLAHRLADLVPTDHRIAVIERSSTFSLGVSNLGLMTGETSSVEAMRRDMGRLRNERIEWVSAEVETIDPAARTVETSAGRFEADHIVVALGAELAPSAVPGLADSAHNLYEAEGAFAINQALGSFDAGRIVILVAGAPFRCPAAPYEAAMLVEAWIRERGRRGQVEIDLFTPESIPMAVAGPAVGAGLNSFLEARGIGVHFGHQATSVDPAAVHFGERSAGYDLLIGIPPHRGPSAAMSADLTDASGYIPVHPQTLEILADPDTLEVRHPGVFAIGDATAIRLMNAKLLPKAGVFAEGQAHTVAAAIAADVNGEPRPGVYDGHGFCYVDVGEGLAAYGAGDFYAFPGPRVNLEQPSAASRQAKDEYERLLDAWFD